MTFSLSTNIVLALAKITWSHKIHSVSMLADGYHALLDSVSGILCLAALLVAQKPPDKDHPYGHIRYEALAQLGVSALLLFTGYEVLSRTYDQFHNQITPNVTSGSYVIMLLAMAVQTITMSLEKVVYQKTGMPLSTPMRSISNRISCLHFQCLWGWWHPDSDTQSSMKLRALSSRY